MKFKGRMWIFEDKNINTDQIFPGKYTYDPLTPEQMVAGQNFGSGSSREQAVICLKAAGVAAVVGISFARIYYRNAINVAFPLIQCADAVNYIFENKEKVKKMDIEIDLTEGIVKIDNQTFTFPPLDGEALNIFKSGGLLEYTKEKLKTKG
ncbi:MAG: 3-isopropylmalate dehydratase [Candidatus Heimdallarchaeota archaeon]